MRSNMAVENRGMRVVSRQRALQMVIVTVIVKESSAGADLVEEGGGVVEEANGILGPLKHLRMIMPSLRHVMQSHLWHGSLITV